MTFTVLSPKNEAEWLNLRREVLTATDIGVILGLNKYKSVAEMVESKVNPQAFENGYTWIGQVLEPVVVKAVNKVTRHNFKLYEDTTKSFFIDRELGLGATPDAHDDHYLLECKTTKPGNALKYAVWPPAYYLSQLYTQLICTDKQSGFLAIMSTNLTQTSEVLTLPLTIHILTRSKELDILILGEVERFWALHKKDKLFRVNRQLSWKIELKLRYAIGMIYG